MAQVCTLLLFHTSTVRFTPFEIQILNVVQACAQNWREYEILGKLAISSYFILCVFAMGSGLLSLDTTLYNCSYFMWHFERPSHFLQVGYAHFNLDRRALC